ncbi:MAG TPA: PIN domain-containing protein [Bryobacteraceae bacterium]
MALLHADHIHRAPARLWWQRAGGPIAFTRFTQISLLRLLTTSAAMKEKPLSMDEAWRAYDRLFEDDRVAFYPESGEVEEHFREYTSGQTASPKLWAYAWLLAVAHAAQGTLITFDQALAARGARYLLAEIRENA